MTIDPTPAANFTTNSCLAQLVVFKLSMLKVLGSIPGESINPFCRCPHFLRSGRSRCVHRSRGENADIDKRDLWIDLGSNRVLSAPELTRYPLS